MNTKVRSKSSEFIVGFPITRAHDITELALFVTTTEVDPVLFVVETLLGHVFTGNATYNSTTIVPLNNTYQVHNSSDRNKGIRIYTGNKHISVRGLIYQHRIGTVQSSGAYLALSCTGLRLNEYVYYALTYHGVGESGSQLLFVACEDNTNITIGSHTISLSKMETYLLENVSDLTGTVAISNNPVSFFSGHQWTHVPTGVKHHDQLIQQLPDNSTWGTHFLSASFTSRDSGEIYRVLASQPSTTVTFTCSTPSQPTNFTLPSAGSWKEITTSDDSFCSIVSNKPVLVVQFALGGGDLQVYGDPFMIMVPAIDQYSNNYVIPFFHQFSRNFITIFVSPEHYQPEDIYVDDVSLEDSNWTAIDCPSDAICGYSVYSNLSTGDHQIYHKNTEATFGVIAYGFDEIVSYGYPGGLRTTVRQGMLFYSGL